MQISVLISHSHQLRRCIGGVINASCSGFVTSCPRVTGLGCSSFSRLIPLVRFLAPHPSISSCYLSLLLTPHPFLFPPSLSVNSTALFFTSLATCLSVSVYVCVFCLCHIGYLSDFLFFIMSICLSLCVMFLFTSLFLFFSLFSVSSLSSCLSLSVLLSVCVFAYYVFFLFLWFASIYISVSFFSISPLSVFLSLCVCVLSVYLSINHAFFGCLSSSGLPLFRSSRLFLFSVSLLYLFFLPCSAVLSVTC